MYFIMIKVTESKFMHASGLWNFVPLETNADGLMGCHQMNLPEGFVCNHFLSIILLKQICLFKAFVSLLLSSLFLLDIDFLFQNIDSNKFPYIYSQINAHNSLLLSNYLIKMSQYPSFHGTFFHFICYIFILQLIFLENTYYYESRRIFFMGTEKLFTFFMVKKDIKSNHNNLLLFNY